MIRPGKCDVCGSEVIVSTSDEGTSCYLPSDRIQELEDALQLKTDFYDSLSKHCSELQIRFDELQSRIQELEKVRKGNKNECGD